MKIILFGLRRSGTTLSFNIFRQCSNLLCFYEPLHPNLVSTEGVSCINEDKKNVYMEYKPFYAELLKYHEGFGAPKYSVAEELVVNNLTNRHFAYLDFLFARAANVLIQPVRLNYQLHQLQARYPDACFVWVIRQPDGFINSVLKYRPDLFGYRDACLPGNYAIDSCKKNFIFRMMRGWGAFDDPWSQIAAANHIVQCRPYLQKFITSYTWLKLLALWYDHYWFVMDFIRKNRDKCFLFSYDKACVSENYIREIMSSMGMRYETSGLSALVDAGLLKRHKESRIDIAEGEMLIQKEFRSFDVDLDLSYRHFISS